jgi:hypothetical protein
MLNVDGGIKLKDLGEELANAALLTSHSSIPEEPGDDALTPHVEGEGHPDEAKP